MNPEESIDSQIKLSIPIAVAEPAIPGPQALALFALFPAFFYRVAQPFRRHLGRLWKLDPSIRFWAIGDFVGLRGRLGYLPRDNRRFGGRIELGVLVRDHDRRAVLSRRHHRDTQRDHEHKSRQNRLSR